MKAPEDFPINPLKKDHIHLWSFPVALYKDYAEERLEFLSEREAAKASRLYREEDRIRCRVVYVLLREILSLYTKIPPRDISIQLSEKGKPFMEGDIAPCFNLSHSGDRMLLAFSSEREVGIDMEWKKEYRDTKGLIGVCCSEGEKREIEKALTDEEKRELFYRFWSSKEAYLKGLGTGISNGLKCVDTSTGKKINGWTVLPCSRWEGYSASVAIQCDVPSIFYITEFY